MSKKNTFDWESIERDYREGASTLREIAARHEVTHGAINKRAKRDGWTRAPAIKDVSKKSRKVSKSVSKQVSKTGIHERLDTNLDTSASDSLYWEKGLLHPNVIPEDEEVLEPEESGPLKKRREVFVDEYLIDLNATQAAIRAGYSAKTANEQGARLLANVSVRAQIKRRIKDREARTEINQDRALYELSAMAYYDPADIGSELIESPADIAKLPERVRRAIIGWSWDKNGNFVLKLATKTPNVELIGRHLGMFKDKLEVTPVGPLPPPEYKIVTE